MNYPITIHHIFISEGHNYFGHTPERLGAHATVELDKVEAVAGQGLVGDRFFNVRPDFDGQITFFSLEVFEQLQTIVGNSVTIEKLRRNVVIQGVPLNQLIGQRFELMSNSEPAVSIMFEGSRQCHPCRWMDIACGDGALQFLKGRGGLRAKILSNGTLYSGTATLSVDTTLDLSMVSAPLAKPRLP